MDFNFTPEDEKFRAEFRAWLDQNRPEREDDDLDFFAEDEGEWNRRVKWFKKLASGGWTCVDWPKEDGGGRVRVPPAPLLPPEPPRPPPPPPLFWLAAELHPPP